MVVGIYKSRCYHMPFSINGFFTFYRRFCYRNDFTVFNDSDCKPGDLLDFGETVSGPAIAQPAESDGLA